MNDITIKDMGSRLERRLRRLAAEHGRSVEDEARDILSRMLKGDAAPQTAHENFGAAIRAIVEPLGGVELDISPRKPIRTLPVFE